jgi:hypothetical protein
MKLTDEIREIEQRMVEDKPHEDFLFSASVALVCFGLLCLVWLIAMVTP